MKFKWWGLKYSVFLLFPTNPLNRPRPTMCEKCSLSLNWIRSQYCAQTKCRTVCKKSWTQLSFCHNVISFCKMLRLQIKYMNTYVKSFLVTFKLLCDVFAFNKPWNSSSYQYLKQHALTNLYFWLDRKSGTSLINASVCHWLPELWSYTIGWPADCWSFPIVHCSFKMFWRK